MQARKQLLPQILTVLLFKLGKTPVTAEYNLMRMLFGRSEVRYGLRQEPRRFLQQQFQVNEDAGQEAALSLRALAHGLTRGETARLFYQICSASPPSVLHRMHPVSRRPAF